MGDLWTEPTPENVRNACTEFDSWRDNPDPALTRLFEQFPENLRFEEVLLKVAALNATYSTQIRAVSDRRPTIYDVARHIVELKIDDPLRSGSPEIVDRIADVSAGTKHQFNYSFATKYCSWHQQKHYSIWDSRVDEYLCQSRDRKVGEYGAFRQFKHKELWRYPSFKAVVIEFQVHFNLKAFSFKEIDKFLYIAGGKFFEKSHPLEELDTDFSQSGAD